MFPAVTVISEIIRYLVNIVNIMIKSCKPFNHLHSDLVKTYPYTKTCKRLCSLPLVLT